MKIFAPVLIAMLTFVVGPAAAQLTCVTKLGGCPLGGGIAPGGSCVCVTASGPVQGVAQAGGSAGPQSNVPGFCCTPSGRMPFSNSSIGPGQPCRAAIPGGVATGQACF